MLQHNIEADKTLLAPEVQGNQASKLAEEARNTLAAGSASRIDKGTNPSEGSATIPKDKSGLPVFDTVSDKNTEKLHKIIEDAPSNKDHGSNQKIGDLSVSGTNEAKMEAIQHQSADINGIKLHYASEGSGEPVLFLHGFPEFWYEWKDQLHEFGQDHMAVAMDMRGYNLSDKPSAVTDYALEKLVSDTKAMFDRLFAETGRSKGILVAHDWGGVVAWNFAAAYPEYLEKLVIINSPHPTLFARELKNNPAQQKASSYINFFRTSGAESKLLDNDCAYLRNAVFDKSSKPEAFTPEDRKAYQRAWTEPGALTASLNYYRAANPTEAPVLPVKVPTLVIWGEQDQAILPGNFAGQSCGT